MEEGRERNRRNFVRYSIDGRRIINMELRITGVEKTPGKTT